MAGGPPTGDGQDARVPRRGRWSWAGVGALAAIRGVWLCGLMLAGLGLVLALLLPVVFAGLGIGLLVSDPEHYHEAAAVAVGLAPASVPFLEVLDDNWRSFNVLNAKIPQSDKQARPALRGGRKVFIQILAFQKALHQTAFLSMPP